MLQYNLLSTPSLVDMHRDLADAYASETSDRPWRMRTGFGEYPDLAQARDLMEAALDRRGVAFDPLPKW